MKITNPVLTGFHADPSMIRVKDTYYIANSTFEWFPGIRLHESKDMVHWNTLPYPLGAEQLDMRGDPASGGVWAPDLSYADGRFWIVYSDVHIVNGAFKDVVNYLTTAEDIRGPWSKPLRLNGVGFDASLFHDDDGRKYLVQQTWDHREYKHQFHGITLTEFDTATMRLKPETARTIWMGDDVKLVEGPHLYKINGWYYLFCAEGGTVWTHQESVARSRTLDELSFEASPTNPFITNFDIPGSYLQKQGHGALVDTRPANGTTRRCAAARGITRPSRSPTRAAGARWGVRPQSRRSSGLRMVGRTSSAVMAANVMWRRRRTRSRQSRPQAAISTTSSTPTCSVSTGTRCVCRSTRRWARSAAAA